MTGRPARVSVVITTRNRSSMLRQALVSALDQGNELLEVIVVDEASSDDTTERIAEIGDERISVVRHEQPRGPAAARNTAMGRARGEWIAFLDDDDIWAPGKLDAQLSRAAEQSQTLSCTGRVEVDEKLSVIRTIRPPADLGAGLLAGNVVGTPSSVIIRADLIERIGPFDEDLQGLADWDLWLRALTNGAVIGACPEPLIAYRRHEAAMTSDPEKMFGDFELLREKHAALAEDAGVEFGSAWLTGWQGARDTRENKHLRPARRYLRKAATDRSAWDVARAIAALGGRPLDRLGRSIIARFASRPDWLERYS